MWSLKLLHDKESVEHVLDFPEGLYVAAGRGIASLYHLFILCMQCSCVSLVPPHSVHLPPPHTSYVQTLNTAKCTFDNLSRKCVKSNEFL